MVNVRQLKEGPYKYRAALLYFERNTLFLQDTTNQPNEGPSNPGGKTVCQPGTGSCFGGNMRRSLYLTRDVPRTLYTAFKAVCRTKYLHTNAHTHTPAPVSAPVPFCVRLHELLGYAVCPQLEGIFVKILLTRLLTRFGLRTLSYPAWSQQGKARYVTRTNDFVRVE